MLREPRTIAPATTLAQARETFANPRVKLLLVADGERYLGTLAPADVPPAGDGPIAPHVRANGPRLDPGDAVPRALELLRDADRVPVVAADGRLAGLVCLNRGRSAFCA